MRGHRDLRLVAAAAVACALVASLVPLEIVRVVAALPLTLLLPGYAVVAAAFARNEPAPPKLWTLSVGTSLALLALGSFVLNVFPFGLTTASWAVLLPVVVVALCRVAALRRGRPRKVPRRRRGPAPAVSARDAVLAGLAVLVAAGALVLAQRPLPADDAAGFTALWMLPEDAREEVVVVGVISSEQEPTSYRLRIEPGGREPPRSFRLSLDPGEERTFRLAAPDQAARRTRVVASLYREERPRHLFRRVTTWLPRYETLP